MSINLRLPLLAVLIAVAFGFGVTNLQITRDAAEAMLADNTAESRAYADYLSRFPNDLGVVIAFVDLACSTEGWDLIKAVELAYRKNAYVDRTIGLPSRSSRYLVYSEDDIDLSRFSDVEFDSPEERCDKAEEYPPFRGLLSNETEFVTAIYLIAHQGLNATDFAASISEMLNPFTEQAEILGGRILLSGEPLISAELSRVVAKDSKLLAAMAVVMCILAWLLTRSSLVALSSVTLNAFVVLVAFGFMGWFGLELTPATSLVVFLLIPLSSAFTIHAHGYVSRQKSDSIVPSEARMPMLLAGVTTCIGFACTGLTPAPDIQAMALMGIIGISAATIGTFTIVFPLLSLRKPSEHTRFESPSRTMSIPPSSAIFFSVVLLGFSLVGIVSLNINYGPANYLTLSNQVRSDFEEVGQWFGRMSVPLVIEADNIQEPLMWQKVEPLVRKLEATYPENFQAFWFYDHIAELSKAFTGDGEEQKNFPDTEEYFSQLLLWFSPEDYELFIDDNADSYVILLQVPFVGSSEFMAMKQTVTDYIIDNELDGQIVGRVAGFFETGHRIGRDNLIGMLIGAALIWLLYGAIYRSLKLATIALFVNALPVLVSLSLLGWLNIDIDMGSSVACAIAFGIVLDDSSHLISAYRSLQLKGLLGQSEAVVRETQNLLRPILFTSLVICVGFSVLFFAEMIPFHDFAMVTIVAIVVAFFTDIVLFPALVRRFCV